jgi:hypothetical protein
VLSVAAVVFAAATIAVAALGLVLLPEVRALQALRAAAVADLEGGRWDQARGSLSRLSEASRRLDGRLRGPIPRTLAAVPLVGRPLRATRVVLTSGARAADIALEALPIFREQTFWERGRVDLRSLRAVRAFAAHRTSDLERELAAVRRSPSWPLPGPVGSARSDLIEELSSAVRGLDVSTFAIDLSERVLGVAGQRRYLIVFENPAEMRGVGGLWANYGLLVARDGEVELGRFGRIDEIDPYGTYRGPDWYVNRYERFFGAGNDWRQLSSGPDFPTVASILERNLDRAEGIGPIDGTIAVDPPGLAAFLRITGPVRVGSWFEPITSDNVVPATLNEAYSRFSDNDRRIAFLGDAAHAVWSKLLDSPITVRGLARSGLGEAIASKHLRLHFTRPEEQRLARALDVDGGLGDPRDTVSLVTQNVAGNKMDYWLSRKLDVGVELRPDGDAEGEATVTLRNDGPASGQPRYVIGPFDDRYRRGWNRQLVRLYLPATTSVRPGFDVSIAREQGFVVVEWYVDVPPGEAVERRVRFRVGDLWNPATRNIRLQIRKQVSLRPDDVRVDLRPPRGWRVSTAGSIDCDRGPTTTDVGVRAGLGRWVPGWILGAGAGVLTCGGTGG